MLSSYNTTSKLNHQEDMVVMIEWCRFTFQEWKLAEHRRNEYLALPVSEIRAKAGNR